MLRSTSFSILGIVSFALLAGCGASGEAGGFAEGGDIYGGGGVVDPSTGTSQGPQSGVLTAGDWDDNLNFDLFQAYVQGHNGQDLVDPFPSADRIIIKAVNGDGEPLSNARVFISSGDNVYLDAPTGSDGRALFFPARDGAAFSPSFTVMVAPPGGQAPSMQTITELVPGAVTEWTFTFAGAAKNPPKALDLAFVIDTTGSMGDELSYLQNEVKNIADFVHGAFAGVSIQYALILYRDDGDDYVTRVFDFTGDLGDFQSKLAQQSSGGGGDEPEAMDEALALSAGLTWRSGNTARLTFLVADAPPHEEGFTPYLQAIEDYRGKGIRLYPVAASGVNPDAEYLMRVGAEATLGRYIFLTDDSGVGEAHTEPHVPCYQVELLSKMLFRAIASELTGARVAANPDDVLRSVGDPVDGVCTLADGTEAYL